jgi:hypothetical protein
MQPKCKKGESPNPMIELDFNKTGGLMPAIAQDFASGES